MASWIAAAVDRILVATQAAASFFRAHLDPWHAATRGPD
jgi:hypothetical protein